MEGKGKTLYSFVMFSFITLIMKSTKNFMSNFNLGYLSNPYNYVSDYYYYYSVTNLSPVVIFVLGP